MSHMNDSTTGPDAPHSWFSRRAARFWLVLIGVPIVLLWQLSIFRTDLQETHKIKVTGLHSEDRFIYYLYYLNLWPVATTVSGRDDRFFMDRKDRPSEPDKREFSRAGAERIIAEQGDSLVQEWGTTIRYENHLQTFLFLPDAWRRGTPKDAETRLANAGFYMLALAGLFTAFVMTRRYALGIFLVIFFGSNPFQLFAAYREENVKSWPITMFCIAAAIIAPLLTGSTWSRRRWTITAVILGALFGTAYQIRSEAAVAMLGVVAVFLTMWNMSWTRRVVMSGVLIASFIACVMSWHAFFHHKIAESRKVVAAAGGHVFDGPLLDYHPLWPSVWPGLGDFDRTHGYELGDAVMIRYLEPIMPVRFGEEIPWWWGGARKNEPRPASDFYDAAQIYFKYPFDSPNFSTPLRDKVVSDILHDPLWFAGIMVKRVWRIMDQTTPVRVFFTERMAPRLPFHGAIAVLIFGIAWWRKDWIAVRLLLLSAPVSLIPMVITSASNFPYYSIYHLCGAAVGLSWLITAIANRRQTRTTTA